jgi:hypothetical protein
MTPNDAINLAKVFEGYKEKENKHNLFGTWYEMDSEPWCGMFVSAVLHWVGVPLAVETDKGYAYCPAAVDYFKSQGKFKNSTPLPGDIVFYDWNGDGTADHTGLVIRNFDNEISAIEGNTSDGDPSDGGTVQIKNRNKSLILGYSTPPYNHVPLKNSEIAKGVPPAPLRVITVGIKSAFLPLWRKQMIERGYQMRTTDTDQFKDDDKKILMSFQEEKGLDSDGELGLQSWLAAWLMPIT